MKTKLLFVCSRNLWRSPTAEALFRGHPRYDARSAGTEKSARIKVTEGHVRWADHILAMERKHVARLREKFPEALEGKEIQCLDIPDDYGFMAPELIVLLRTALSEYLDPQDSHDETT